MPVLQIKNAVSDENQKILKKLLSLSAQRRKSDFTKLCGKNFATYADLRKFIERFPANAFVLDTDEMESELSYYLVYLAAAKKLPQWKTEIANIPEQPIFGRPEYTKQALTFSRPGA